MDKLYKLHQECETREGLEGRKCRISRYSLMKRQDGYYRFDGPFVFVYRHYDDQGNLVKRNSHVVCEVGGDLVVLKPGAKETAQVIQAIRATMSNQEA